MQDATDPAGSNAPAFESRRIHYLAFDGGGGKAPVFLGAVRALAELGLLPAGGSSSPARVTGFSGSSTGAILASLLSCRIAHADVERCLGTVMTDLCQSGVPANLGRPAIRPDAVGGVRFTCDAITSVDGHWPLLELILRQRGAFLRLAGYLLPVHRLEASLRDWMLDRMGFDRTVVDGVSSDILATVRNLQLNAGALGGSRVRESVDQVLGEGVRVATGRAAADITFRQHYAIFGSELRLSATNLSSGKGLYLCRRTTPDLPVADAVRLCISLPFLVKPVYFSPRAAELAGASKDYAGVWIDGGVLNGSAARAFRSLGDAAESGTVVLRCAADGHTAASERVDDRPLARIVARSLYELLFTTGRVTDPGSGGGEEVVTLSADGMTVHQFEPDADLLRDAQERAYEQAMRRLCGA